jgi:hypothetical protein
VYLDYFMMSRTARGPRVAEPETLARDTFYKIPTGLSLLEFP